jgi:hypothetical protein
MPERPGAAQRDASIARIANQHAEAVLAHAMVVNGYRLTDEQFDAFAAEVRDALAATLQAIDTRSLAAELPEGDPARMVDDRPRAFRAPRTIPAVVTRF